MQVPNSLDRRLVMPELYGSDACAPNELARRIETVGGGVRVGLIYLYLISTENPSGTAQQQSDPSTEPD